MSPEGLTPDAITYKMWVGGQEIAGEGEQLAVEDPSTRECFASCFTASPSDADNAVRKAHAAFESGVWSRAPRHQRAEVLDRCADLLTEELPQLIPLEVRQTGRVIREMSAQVPTLTKWFRYFAALLRTEERAVLPTMGKLHNWVDRLPLGVVVLITPFNHPLLIAVKKLAPALAAGNSVVVKPSELTPITTLLLGPILQRAGVPDGVFQVVPGVGASVGRLLVEHTLVRKVDLTGGLIAGRAVGAITGPNMVRYTAELGGKAPLLIFSSIDVDVAVNGIAFGSFIAAGQTCVASTRIIVHNSILPQLLDKLAAKVDSIAMRMGATTNPRSTMGPLISRRAFDSVTKMVDEAIHSDGAIALSGGHALTGPSPLDGHDFSMGYYFAPTVLTSNANDPKGILNSRIWKEEAFGPVIVVTGFDTEVEAVTMANDSIFGLGAGVWTNDLSQAFRVSEQVEAGIVWVNTHHRNDPSSPWGGATPASGVGSENGWEAYCQYTKVKSTIVNFASAEESLAMEDWFKEDAQNVRYG